MLVARAVKEVAPHRGRWISNVTLGLSRPSVIGCSVARAFLGSSDWSWEEGRMTYLVCTSTPFDYNRTRNLARPVCEAIEAER